MDKNMRAAIAALEELATALEGNDAGAEKRRGTNAQRRQHDVLDCELQSPRLGPYGKIAVKDFLIRIRLVAQLSVIALLFAIVFAAGWWGVNPWLVIALLLPIAFLTGIRLGESNTNEVFRERLETLARMSKRESGSRESHS